MDFTTSMEKAEFYIQVLKLLYCEDSAWIYEFWAQGHWGHQDGTPKTNKEPYWITRKEEIEEGMRHLRELKRRKQDGAAGDTEPHNGLITIFTRTLEDLAMAPRDLIPVIVDLIETSFFKFIQQKKGENVVFHPMDPLTDIAEPVDILLDVNTAYDRLHLSEDRKTACWTFVNKNRPESPERFEWRPQVLSSQSFSAGSHRWDVEVQGSDDWRVGVCYPSIERKRGVPSVIGNNEKSWCLCRSHHCYSVIHGRKKTCLFGGISGDTIRIALDYKSGQISFHELGISDRHLHTFTTTFTEPLHAALGVWRGSVKISGGTSGGVRNGGEWWDLAGW